MKYAIVEIVGKQYKIIPNQPIEVGFLGDVKKIDGDMILLCEDGEIKMGTPFLKDKLTLEVLGDSTYKIRVAKYSPKANYRRVRGSKNRFSKVIFHG